MKDEILLKNLTEKHETYQLESDRISFQVNSALLIASSAILAVSTITGEYSDTSGSVLCLPRILSKLTIGINALCILLLAASLYGYAVRSKRIRDALRAKIQQELNRPGEEYGVVLNISTPKVFSVCEKIAYVSFALFIISLAAIGLMK